MKINAGCGNKVLAGWTNVDLFSSHPDVVKCDLRNLAPFPSASADTVMAIHVIEHFFRWDVPKVLGEFYRVLRSGGHLILEQPNILLCAVNAVRNEPEQQGLQGMYGEQHPVDNPAEQMAQLHKWGWSPVSLESAVIAAGFRDVVTSNPTQYHRPGREHRDFRLEARKQNAATKRDERPTGHHARIRRRQRSTAPFHRRQRPRPDPGV